MTTQLPDPNSLRAGLMTLLNAIGSFENQREAVEHFAESSDKKVSARVDGLGRVISVSIAATELTATAADLATKVKGVVNSAIAAADAASATATKNFASALSLPGLPAFGSAPPNFPDFPSMVTQLSAQIISGNPCNSTRVFSCVRGSVTAVVDAKRRVVSLTFREPLPDLPAPLETDIVRALNCSIDAGTDRPDDTHDGTTTIIGSKGLRDLVLYANGTLKLDDRAKVKTQGCVDFAGIANAGTVETNIGVQADVFSIVSRANVTVRERGRVHGPIQTSGVLDKRTDAEVAGPVTEHIAVVLPNLALNVTFPQTPVGTIELEPDQQATAAPGYYRKLQVKSRSTVFVSSGVYYFDEFFLEPDSQVKINASAGPVVMWVKNAFTFRGAFVDSGGGFPRIFVGYLGTSLAVVDKVYRGTLSAPNARINIATVTQTYEGAFHGKDIEVFPDVTICHRPFELGYDDLPGLTPPGGSPPPVVDLGFENLAGWSSPQVALVSAQNPVIQGAKSLKITTLPGSVDVQSANFSADLAPTGVTRLLVELWVPATQPNPTFFGNLIASISIPSANLNNVNLGSLGLTSRPLNQFSVFDFALPTAVRQALDGNHSDVSLKLTLAGNSGSGPWYFDNVRFSLPAPGTPTPPSSLDPILSFETSGKWTSSQATLSTVSSPKTHSAHALKVASPQTTAVITSVPFSSAALSSPQARVRIDVWASSTQPNPSFHGRVQMKFDVPSAGISDAATSSVDLTPLPKNAFNTIELVLPTIVKNAIDGTFEDVKAKIVLTVAAGAGPYHFDNIRFV